MIESLMFGIGKRGNKHHAWADLPEGRIEGPARDTEEEAIADRDEFGRMAGEYLKNRLPHATITINKVQ